MPNHALKIKDLGEEESVVDDELVIVPIDLDASGEEEDIEESEIKK